MAVGWFNGRRRVDHLPGHYGHCLAGGVEQVQTYNLLYYGH